MLGVLWLRPTLTHNRFAANLVYTLYLAVASFFEEKRLIRELGPDYTAYRRRVPRLLPALKRR
jgi:protein-S-isoprenylcysteine O-methyltransferase Ste14